MRHSIAAFLLIVAVSPLLTSGQSRTGNNAPPLAGFQVSGIVVNVADGAPLGRTQVFIRLAEATQSAKTLSVTTGDDGRFRIKNVPQGKYSIFARRVGFPVQSLDAHDQFATAVAVGPDKDSQNIIFRMHPEASIAGRISDEYGDPVANGTIVLFHRGSELGRVFTHLRQRVQTDAHGNYHINHLPAGEYFLVVTAQPWYAQYRQPRRTGAQDSVVYDGPPQSVGVLPASPEEGDANLELGYPATYYSGALDSKSATAIQLHDGERFEADMILNSVPAFDVKTVNAEGKATGNTQSQIEVLAFGRRMNLNANMRGNGTSNEFTGITPGRYSLRQRAFAEGSIASQQQQGVEISSDGTVQYQQPAAGTPVTGTITLEGSAQPIRNTQLQFIQRDNVEGVSAQTNAKGEFVPFQLFPGRYDYSANSNQGVIKSLTATGAKVHGRTIEVGSEPVVLNVVMADIAIRIDGVALGEDGRPLAGAMVVLIPEDVEFNENLNRRDQSDSDGTFTLRVVLPGKYTLVAIQNGWGLEWLKRDVIQPFLKHGLTVDVRPRTDMKVKVNVQSASK